jgi:hypothetical protein
MWADFLSHFTEISGDVGETIIVPQKPPEGNFKPAVEEKKLPLQEMDRRFSRLETGS